MGASLRVHLGKLLFSATSEVSERGFACCLFMKVLEYSSPSMGLSLGSVIHDAASRYPG